MKGKGELSGNWTQNDLYWQNNCRKYTEIFKMILSLSLSEETEDKQIPCGILSQKCEEPK